MSYTRQEFINKIAPMAQQDMARTGILASVTIAQAILESGDGNTGLAQKSNNLFGIKGSYNGQSASYQTQECINGVYVTIQDAFRVYPSWAASVADHSDLLSNNRYRLSGVTDYRDACNTLQNQGYATAPNYASTLIALIEQHELWRYDNGAVSGSGNTINYAAKIVEIALQQEGNVGGQPYWSYMGFANRVAWCACFVSWCANEAGISADIIPRTALVHTYRTFAEGNGRFYYKGDYTPKAGDIMIHESNGASHTGIVVSSDGVVYNTIEGNSSDQCRQRSYPLTNPSLTGFFSPNYPVYSGSGTGNDQKNSNITYAEKVLSYLHDVAKDKKKEAVSQKTVEIDKTILNQSKFTNVQLIVFHGKDRYLPVVKDSIQWQLQRRGYPGILTFSIIPDKTLKFENGDPIQFLWNNQKVFFGFLFSKKTNEDGAIECTCYDQLRYLKNKDTYVYKMKRLDEVICMIADDFGLKVGKLPNTQYPIPSRIEDNKTLFDVIGSAMDETMIARKKMYVLYDDFGKLKLSDAANMKVDLLVDEETGQAYQYESSIDGETYNKVKLSFSNDQIRARELYVSLDSNTIAKWGVLQYYETISSNTQSMTGAKEAVSVQTALALKAENILGLYNAEEKSLNMKGCFGDLRVRAGSSVIVRLAVDGKEIFQYMMVEKVTHTFEDMTHTMDLTLRGGGFSE